MDSSSFCFYHHHHPHYLCYLQLILPTQLSGLAGDQTTGRELLAHLAAHLLHSYNKVNHPQLVKTFFDPLHLQDPRVRDLLDNVQVSILPAANPDGFTRAHKGSCSGTRRREGERNAAEVEENYL